MVYTDPGKTVEENISGLQKTKSGIGKDMGNKINLFFLVIWGILLISTDLTIYHLMIRKIDMGMLSILIFVLDDCATGMKTETLFAGMRFMERHMAWSPDRIFFMAMAGHSGDCIER